MNIHIQYNKPTKDDICVAFTFFNPCGYVRPLQNLVFFENKLRMANIPYYSAEMIIGDKPQMISNPTCIYKSKSNLFYKEALFNKLEKFIPEKYTKIIFLDSDIIFDCVDWVDRISNSLDNNDIIQVFENACYLDLTYNENYWKKASTVDYNPSGTGLGWAMTRSFLHKIGGFFDKCMLGSGDTILFYSIMNKIDIKYPVIQDYIGKYRETIAEFNPKWTYLSGVNIYHLTHGSRVNRKYSDRYNILKRSDLTWDKLFYKNDDGFWELRDSNINEEFLNYFKNRNEDAICSYIEESNSTVIGAIPPENLNKQLSTKGHSGGYAPPSKRNTGINKQVFHRLIPYIPINKQLPQNIIHMIKPLASLTKTSEIKAIPGLKTTPVIINAHRAINTADVKETAIQRYSTSQANTQMIIQKNNLSASQAAAVKSLVKRTSIKDTVVYNRSTVAPTLTNYESDGYYSD